MNRRSAVHRWIRPLTLGAAAWVMNVGEPSRVGAQAKVCARPATGTWTVTGVVASGAALGTCAPNPNWAPVVPYAMKPGVGTANAATTGTIRLTRFTGHLFIGFAVANDDELSDLDQVAVVFDKENDGAWNDGDFYILLKLQPPSVLVSPTGGAACNVTVLTEYYRFSAADGGFVKENTAGVATAVAAKAAYDYETATDGETSLWNLEIDVPIGLTIGGTKFFDLQTAGNGFAMGAYVFAAKGQSPPLGNVLRWPESIVDRQVSQVDLSSPAIDPNTLADVMFTDVCFDMNFAVASPLTSNSMTEVNKTGPTTFKMWYYFAGPAGTAPGAGQNNGTLRIRVYRTTASTSWTEIFGQTKNVSLTDGFNKAYSTTFDMASGGGTEATDFCSDVYLETWQFDDDKSDASNHHHVNYIPFATSEVTKDIDLPVDSIPGLARGASTNLVLYISSSNDPGRKPLTAEPRFVLLPFDGTPLGMAILLIVGSAALAGAVALARRRRAAGLALGMISVAALVEACRKNPPVPPIGNDRWTVANAREIGLTPIPNEPGWYRMPAQQGQLKRATFRFTGRDLPYRTVTDSLPMRLDSAGRPVMKRIPVRRGQVVSVFALGKVDVDGDGPLQPTNAAGLIRSDSQPEFRRLAATYPLARSRYVPRENVGTLIGSFDGGRTSFVIGTNASFVVPTGTEELVLTINALPTDFRRATGAFNLKWIVSDGPSVPTATNYAFETPHDLPTFVLPWLVLTTVNIRTFYEVPVKDAKTGVTLVGRANLGEAHLSVYESHPQ